MKIDFQSELSSLHLQILRGAGASARRRVEEIAGNKIPRPLVAGFSEVARRVHAPEISLRLLHRLVRPSGAMHPPATTEETAEYAVALIRIGATEEGLALLDKLEPSSFPQVWLYRSFALFTHWRYAEAIPLLERFLEARSIPDYLRLVARVNLAACHVHENNESVAKALLETLIEETRKAEALLLCANLHELLAELHISQQRWAEAERALDTEASLLTNAPEFDSFFMRKWKAIARLLSGQSNGIEVVLRVREDAVSAGHAETVRQLDLYRAIATRDKGLFNHVFYGTPFSEYQKQILALWKDGGGTDSKYVREFELQPSARRFDLETGKEFGGKATLKPGNASHRLFSVLASDFYRPIRLAELHYRLFPKEYFNPISSPLRVHVALKRFRLWFEKNKIPLEVRQTGTRYALAATGPYAVIVPTGVIGKDRLGLELDRLKGAIGGREFVGKDVAQVLKLPLRTAQRLVTGGIERGQISKQGKGAVIRYRFK